MLVNSEVTMLSPTKCSGYLFEAQDMMILDAYGAFLAEAGPQQESIAVLQLAVQQQPNEGFEKYM